MAILLSVFLTLIAAEVGSRVFWRSSYAISLRKPACILYAVYPELEGVDEQRPVHEDEFYDVLLLGGSSLHRDWGSIEQDLRERLACELGRKVRTFNLAKRAQTSRDSWLKYAALAEARFELVIFYHGINETRANNAPPEIFREDYSHFLWYDVANTLASYHGAASVASPYTLRFAAVQARAVFRPDQYVSMGPPREAWLQYGRNPRSPASFRSNLSAILDLASKRGDRVLLATFATYAPPNYSVEAFKQWRLDYRLHINPIELWGRPEDVLASVALHNQVVRDLTARYPGGLFVDQAKLMPGSALYFNDVCHFTVPGSAKFVDNLLGVLLPSLKSH